MYDDDSTIMGVFIECDEEHVYTRIMSRVKSSSKEKIIYFHHIFIDNLKYTYIFNHMETEDFYDKFNTFVRDSQSIVSNKETFF